MKKVLRVKVEDMHIRCGVHGTSESCPVALALTPLLPAGKRASVGFGWFGVLLEPGGPHLETYDLPQSATDFIRDYDQRKPVEPFEFEVEVES